MAHKRKTNPNPNNKMGVRNPNAAMVTRLPHLMTPTLRERQERMYRKHKGVVEW